MEVHLIAHTSFNEGRAASVSGYIPNSRVNPECPTDSDGLSEFAGRLCYQSWSRPNPATATNKGYLENIINQGHFSVLEHANATFYVTGVSRSLLAEITRHRHLSFSVISQRYVRMHEFDVVIHPLLLREWNTQIQLPDGETTTIGKAFNDATGAAFRAYDLLADKLMQLGYPRKKAMEAAREVLPNATGVDMVVTGNLRAWRDVISRRIDPAADAQIQQFARLVLARLKALAPNAFQDFDLEEDA